MTDTQLDRNIAATRWLRAGSTLDSLVGGTPLIRFPRLAAGLSRDVNIYGKAECYNPGGSVKDRPAAAILQRALAEGLLEEGRVFLDSTSGNMGIAYATLGAALGVRIHLAIPANASPERLQILRALGAELTLTDPLEGTDGAREVAAELARREPARFYYADQYSNPANWRAHYEGTGPEVVEQTQGMITHFVAGMGTTGTITGVGRYLRQLVPAARVIAVQPDGPLHGLEGLKHLATSPVPEIYDPAVVDEVVTVATEAAHEMLRQAARLEGVLLGVSAGAALVATLQIARNLDQGTVVTVLPDSGMKYLSQPFWSRP
ncbi:MAG TPA: PLP-dependent cysteine synthase family protein [Chloroflexi bacterium]|nr:PLP-dependent cysteine synthase family protein [Chloroflexota bacterium]